VSAGFKSTDAAQGQQCAGGHAHCSAGIARHELLRERTPPGHVAWSISLLFGSTKLNFIATLPQIFIAADFSSSSRSAITLGQPKQTARNGWSCYGQLLPQADHPG